MPRSPHHPDRTRPSRLSLSRCVQHDPRSSTYDGRCAYSDMDFDEYYDDDGYGGDVGWQPKDSVESRRYTKRWADGPVDCGGGGGNKKQEIASGTHIVELWHEIESVTPFDCERYWSKVFTMCSGCWDADCSRRHGRDDRLPPPLPKPTYSDSSIRLDCPFEWKDHVKRHGAKWHPAPTKKWIVPAGVDLADLNDLNVLPRAVTDKLLGGKSGAGGAPSSPAAARTCLGCSANILSSEPKWKKRCYDCWRVWEVSKRKATEGGGASSSSSSPRRPANKKARK